MKRKIILGLILCISISCEKSSEEKRLDSLIQSLEEELSPLPKNPMQWSNNDLKFLDLIATKSIVGLGEATHGTSEFFKAKHRIFKYLVENHGYKIFAFEADFGESLLINEAVQKGDSNSIENLMKTKMHFWTWNTEEVKDLLVWMCTYNLNKSEAEKVQYMGIDCQFNTFNPVMVKEYLFKTNASFYSTAIGILDEAKSASEDYFKSYSQSSFNDFIKKIEDLQDSVSNNKIKLIQASSEKQYLIHQKTLEVVRQVSIQNFYYQKKDYSVNYRDQFMAENAIWMLEYFEDKKVVIWAHNGHIANNSTFDGSGSLGSYISREMGDKYTTVGFLFSRGSFIAMGKLGDQSTGLKEQVINVAPKENSVNYLMSQCKESVFSVNISNLIKHEEWYDAIFYKGIQYFQIGSSFNNVPDNYYSKFMPAYFDYIIYFNESNPSVILK